VSAGEKKGNDMRLTPKFTTTEELNAYRHALARGENPAEESRPGSDSLVMTYQAGGVLYGAAFWGKSARPLWHYRFRTAEQRQENIDRFWSGLAGHQELKAKQAADRKARSSISAVEINGVRCSVHGVKTLEGKHVPAWYMKGTLINGALAITICAKNYGDNLPRELGRIENDTDVQTDYFDKDRVRFLDGTPEYAALLPLAA